MGIAHEAKRWVADSLSHFLGSSRRLPVPPYHTTRSRTARPLLTAPDWRTLALSNMSTIEYAEKPSGYKHADT